MQLRRWRKHSGRTTIFSLGLGVADALAAIGVAYGLAHTLASLQIFARGGPGWLTGPIVLMAALLSRSLMGAINQGLNLHAARDIIKTVRLNLISDTLTSGGLGDRQRGGFTTLFEDTEALEGYYAAFMPAQTQSAIAPLIILLAVAFQSPACALILLGSLIPFVTLMMVVGLASADAARQQFASLARLSNLFADRIKAMALILSFDDTRRQTDKVARAAQATADRTLAVLKVAFLSSAVLEFFAALSIALVAVYSGFYLLHQLPFEVPSWLDFRGSAFESAFFCLAVSAEIYAPMRRLSSAYHERQQAMAATERLMELQDNLAHGQPRQLILLKAPVIEFQSVSYSFPDDPDFRIGPVSFAAAAGSVTALTGATGSGKSTLLRQMLSAGLKGGPRLCGEILIDGHTVKPDEDLSAAIAWMSQTTPIIAGSLKDNILLANRSADVESLQRVISLSGLGALVSSRPGGLEHHLDERGSGLSGGERRRIGLARALLKPAPILILDEPTADLDAQAEAEIITALVIGFAGRTVLMATHSEALLALADQRVSL